MKTCKNKIYILLVLLLISQLYINSSIVYAQSTTITTTVPSDEESNEQDNTSVGTYDNSSIIYHMATLGISICILILMNKNNRVEE